METAKANSLRLDDDLAPLIRRNEVVVLGGVRAGNHGFSVPGHYVYIPPIPGVRYWGYISQKNATPLGFYYMNRSCALTQWNDSIIPRHDVRSNYAMLPAFTCFLASSIEACTAAGAARRESSALQRRP